MNRVGRALKAYDDLFPGKSAKDVRPGTVIELAIAAGDLGTVQVRIVTTLTGVAGGDAGAVSVMDPEQDTVTIPADPPA